METIFILLGVILVCAVILSPFYFFRKKEPPTDRNAQRVRVPLWKAVLMVLSEGCLFLVVLAYFVLKGEGVLASSWLWVPAAIGVVVLHGWNRKVRIFLEKADGGGRSVVAYKVVSE